VLRSLRPYGDSTATIAFVRRLSCDCTNVLRLLRPYYDAAATMATPLRSHGDLTRTQHSRRVCACSK